MECSELRHPRTVRVGKESRCITWLQRALQRGEELNRALRPKKGKKLLKGEENQLRLPGV